MKKGDLKNRLRRRTADKLYDLDRSAGGVPVRLPTVEPAEAERPSGRRNGSGRSKRRLGRVSARWGK